jgi:signal transduction histidine kinase
MTSDSQVSHFSELIGSAAAVVGEVDLDRVLRRLVTEARHRTGAAYAAMGVLGTHGVLSDFVYEGIDEETARKIGSLPLGRGVLGTVVREKRTIVLNELSSHPDSFGFPEGHPPMSSFLGVPVKAGSSVYGNLYLTDKAGGFKKRDVDLVEALAVIAGSAVSTARLRDRLKTVAIVEDRDRIARDLHDSVIQDLFAIGLSLQSMSDRVSEESVAAVMDRSVDQLHTVVETLRKYIYELRSAEDIRETLSQQLTYLIERMGNAYPTEMTLDVDDQVDLTEPRMAEEVVKLVTEVLSNALRHSKAEMLSVSAHSDGAELTLRVADNGTGFDVDKVNRGMGLLNMGERVRRLGGELSIESIEGTGTTVSIRLPVL